MKFTVASIIAAAAVASAQPLFNVTDFSAGCVAHSVECHYSFNVIQNGNGETIPVSCSGKAVSDNTLPPVVGTCGKSSRTFTVTRDDSGLTLTLSQPVSPASNQTASHLIKNSEILINNDLVAHYETYKGPSSFTLDA